MGIDSLSVRGFWPSTHGSIPPDWSRDDACNERFLQGGDSGYAGPTDAGGVHGHIADPSTHIGNPHFHVFTGGSASPSFTQIKESTKFPFLAGVDITVSHDHIPANGAYETITYQEETVTIEETDALPSYMKLIVIKPDSAVVDFPDDAVCYTDTVTGVGAPQPTGFTKYAPLDDSFVRAPAEGQDSDLTGFGDLEHAHESPVHAPGIDVHSHDEIACGAADPTVRGVTGTPTVAVFRAAHHNVAMGGKALNDLSDVAVTVEAASSEPAYVKLLGIRNTSGSPATPVGVIMAFVAAAGTVPSNWRICDGDGGTVDCRNRQIKSTGTSGEIGDTGGDDEHTHPVPGTHEHVHTGPHNHPVGGATLTGIAGRKIAAVLIGAVPQIGGTHTHVWTINNVTPTLQAASVTLSGTEDKRSAYRTVIWIKKMIERPGPEALLASLF